MLRPKIIWLVVQLLVLLALPATGAETTTPNDTARLLAGLAPSAASPLQALTRDPAWISHATTFDAAFADFERRHLAQVRSWSSANLAIPANSPLIYMFSGPDILYATAFFPKAPIYVMAGLEPVGDIPELTSLPTPTIMNALVRIERALNTVLAVKYFFITREMSTQLAGPQITGTLPVLYVFLARSGKTIQESSHVVIDEQGNIRPRGEKEPPGRPQGIRISFSDADGRHILYYFSTNLLDEHLKNSSFWKFLEQFNAASSLLKNASYLLHSNGFSLIRNYILTHSTAIVQDDSGVPLKYFNPKSWGLHAFGRYVVTNPIFTQYYQPEMDKLFEASPPLGFSMGYHYDLATSNLLLAQRRGAEGSR